MSQFAFFYLFKAEETQSYQGLFDQSFSVHGDCFGDEEMAVDLIGEFATSTLNIQALHTNEMSLD